MFLESTFAIGERRRLELLAVARGVVLVLREAEGIPVEEVVGDEAIRFSRLAVEVRQLLVDRRREIAGEAGCMDWG